MGSVPVGLGLDVQFGCQPTDALFANVKPQASEAPAVNRQDKEALLAVEMDLVGLTHLLALTGTDYSRTDLICKAIETSMLRHIPLILTATGLSAGVQRYRFQSIGKDGPLFSELLMLFKPVFQPVPEPWVDGQYANLQYRLPMQPLAPPAMPEKRPPADPIR